MAVDGIKLTQKDIEKYNKEGMIYATRDDINKGNSVNVNSNYFADNNSEVYLSDDGKLIEVQDDGSEVYMGWMDKNNVAKDPSKSSYDYNSSMGQVTRTNADGSTTVASTYKDSHAAVNPNALKSNSDAYKANEISKKMNEYVENKESQPFSINPKDPFASQTIQSISTSGNKTTTNSSKSIDDYHSTGGTWSSRLRGVPDPAIGETRDVEKIKEQQQAEIAAAHQNNNNQNGNTQYLNSQDEAITKSVDSFFNDLNEKASARQGDPNVIVKSVDNENKSSNI